MMTEVRGASNEKAKRGRPGLRYPSWRLGFREGLEQEDGQPVGSSA